MKEIPKAYDPSTVEDKWYAYWENHKLYHSEIDKSKKSYSIVIPPPNVTGILTMGHILNNTIQDVYIRYKRMKGFNACWVPGTDHASIATEGKVTAFLKEQGLIKKEIGREEFLKHCWDWTKKYGGIITKQLRKLGVSCDWERERFTMDDHYYKKVIESFVDLFKKDKIYRGYRMVNWCPVSKSAISDEEVVYRTVQSKLWYLKYPVKDSDDFVIVATTRPETMLGDTGIAVNPDDDRYSELIGKKIILPIVGREIPVFADDYVDMSFGTGAVKVTPAHDVNDYEMAKRHNLEIINIFNEDATLNKNVPDELQGLDRYEAREKVISLFDEEKLIHKIEDYTTSVGYSDRGGVPIEPYLSEQWFMSMSELAAPALRVVLEGKINFHPDHWVKTFDHWMTNIKDWCISRQLWWGHRIPVWYHKKTNEIYCSVNPPDDAENWRQDEDVLDTWASSWLWAHDVFVNEEEQIYYYPTDLLVTAPDIIFFWVARMIMAGLEFRKDIPFHDVYFTSIIRDIQGRKMSKSLGNSPDPLDVISEYGADALRFTVLYLAPLGQDVLFSTDKCELGRNFANKIWNAGRFLLMNCQTIELNPRFKEKHIDFADQWIVSRFQSTLQIINQAMDNFEINNVTKFIYSYVWNDFCDWYIEMMKSRLYGNDEEVKSAVLTRAVLLFEEMLKIVHPFMPFITEELWNLLADRKEGESISTSSYPEFEDNLINKRAEEEFEFVEEFVTSVRNIRGEMSIAPSKNIDVYFRGDELTENQKVYIKKLGKIENIFADKNLKKPAASASSVVKGKDLFIPLAGIIDLEVEKNRLQKEITRLEGSLHGVNKKLSNWNFINNAPAEVVDKEKQKKTDWEEKLVKLQTMLNDLK